jgi:diacylglycerol O-acyltransferase / wax synthase
MDRLTPLADAFLEAEREDSKASLAIGSFSVFAGPAPPFEDFVRVIEERLPLVPRYRQKLRTAPFGVAAPAWVDDPAFDVRWHIRNTALPSPGGDAEIGRLLSRVMTRRMDLDRPLWEYWFCEGLAGGKWGLVSKVHHSVVDGVSGTDIYRLLLDASPETRASVRAEWHPAPPESTVSFTARALYDSLRAPADAARAIGAAFGAPWRLALRVAQTAIGLLTLTGALRPVDDSSLTGPLDGSRRYAWTTVSLSDIRTVRGRFGVTVNDVALTAATGGFRRLLLSRGEEPTAHAVRSLVPVSTRESGAESIPDNRVSLMLPYLPVDLPDPRDRLAAVKERIRALRTAGEPAAGASLTAAAEYGPFPPVAMGIRLGLRLPQHLIATVTTNVPGPRQTLYALGRELEQILPYVPIADRVRIGVAMFSYRDALTFGITGDYHSVSDIEVLADGIAQSMAELVQVAEQSGAAMPPRATEGPSQDGKVTSPAARRTVRRTGPSGGRR